MSQLLDEMSVPPVEPSLVSLFFCGIRDCINVFSVFSLKPMHKLSIEISRLLEGHMLFMLNNDVSDAVAVNTVAEVFRSFNTSRQTVFATLNLFLTYSQKQSLGVQSLSGLSPVGSYNFSQLVF